MRRRRRSNCCAVGTRCGWRCRPISSGSSSRRASQAAAAYGVDSQKQLDADIFRDWWKLQNPMTVLRRSREYVTEGWAEMSQTLTTLAEDADLILTGTTYQEVAANVAEAHDVPLAALHYFPCRMNSHVLPVPLPGPVLRTGWSAVEWGHWRVLKAAEDAQRRALGLPKAKVRAVRRIVEGGALEIQAYDEVFFPGLSEEWRGSRPLVGSLSLELPTADDDELADWIAAGTPPIYFGFGSMPVESPTSAIAMITSVCAELGERALISTGVLGRRRTTSQRPGQTRRRGEPLQGLCRLPRGGPPRRRGHHCSRRPGRRADGGAVGVGRPAGMGRPDQPHEGRCRPAILPHLGALAYEGAANGTQSGMPGARPSRGHPG